MVKSFVINKIETRESSIHGRGMFAKEKIKKGEVVFIKGGHILPRKEFFSSDVINSYLPIDDEYYLAAKTQDEELGVKLFNNHSCNPNCGLRGEITFVAIRDIDVGEEITCDYAFIDNEDYSFKCNCGSINCRHNITGRDWQIKNLQERYYPYFAQYLKEKMHMKR